MLNSPLVKGVPRRLPVAACAAVLFFLFPAAAVSQPVDADSVDGNVFIELSNQFSQRIEALQQEIAELEFAGGPYSDDLRKPLIELTHLYIDAGEFDEAESLLNRRLQILRVNEGPGTLSQLPAILELMTKDLRQGNLSGISDQFQFLTWLHTRNPNLPPIERLGALDNLATWHQGAVYIDSPANRIYHFLDYRSTTETMLQLAEQEYGRDSLEIVPYLYREALLKWHEFSFARAEDELSHDYRAKVAGWSSTRFLVDEALGIVREIQDIVDRQGDAEARAMALIFETDFLKLANPMSPNVNYRRARSQLLETGLPNARIEHFFEQATVIPMARYHFTLEEAISEQEPALVAVELAPEGDETGPSELPIVEFVAWNESLPFARRPQTSGMIESFNVPLYSVLMEVVIGATGHPSRLRILGTTSDDPSVLIHARDAMRRFTFRPNSLSWWLSKKKSVNLLYVFPPEHGMAGRLVAQ